MTYESQRRSFLGTNGQEYSERHYSEETAREIDCAVRQLTEQARLRAMDILNTYRRQLDETAKRLLEKETLLADELPLLEPAYDPKQPRRLPPT